MKKNDKKCIISSEKASRMCPIVGGLISDTTCIELCLWADFIDEKDQVWLEYIDKIKNYCKEELNITEDKIIAKICINCPAHYVEL